jgi:serine/threonine protein kinase
MYNFCLLHTDEPCSLEWSITYGIVKGICEGLKHLHTGSTNPIYHLDLKPANILLDEDMIPKIGDFGLSRLLVSTQTCVTQTFIGTR